MLHIDLVPKSMWGWNARAVLSEDSWSKLRVKFGAAGFSALRCKECGASQKVLDLHEVWQYDDTRRIQKLVDLVPICDLCHSVVHIGHTRSLGVKEFDAALVHLAKVNNWSEEHVVNHARDAMQVWHDRSRHKYSLDLSFLDRHVEKSRIHLEWLGSDNRYARSKSEVILKCRELIKSDALILDTETTGLLKRSRSEVIEIGIIDMSGSVVYEGRFKPRGKIPKGAIKIHGIVDEDLAGSPRFSDSYSKIEKVLNGRTVVAYNAKFDSEILRRTCEQYGMPPIDARWVCAMWLYKNYLASRYLKGLPKGEHAAVADAKATLSLLNSMARGE